MKKSLFVLALILICGSAEAKYCVSDADGLKVLYGVNQSCEEYAKELGVAVTVVDSIPDDRTDRDCWRLVDGAVVVDESCATSQEAYIKKFNPELAIAREAQVFDAEELIRLAPVSYTINALISYKNFTGGVANGVPYAGLKQLLQGLVSGGIILQSDAEKLSGILAEQGISLND